MEKRTVEIDIETARQWYKSDNQALKEVALKAFTEEELRQSYLVTNWADYVSDMQKECLPIYRVYTSQIHKTTDNYQYTNHDAFTSLDVAKAYRALGKLINLRDAWWRADNNWKPDWTDGKVKSCIEYSRERILGIPYRETSHVLAFRTTELRNKFLETFRDLIEEAKMFI